MPIQLTIDRISRRIGLTGFYCTSYGKCLYCSRNLQAHCLNGGWQLGNEIDGSRLNTSLYAAPKALQDGQLLLLSDDLPTGFEIGVRSAKIAPGETVAVVDDSRPAIAEELGAIMTINPTKLTMNSVLDEIIKAINSDTEGSDTVSTNQTPKPGVDVAMEYVVAPQTFDTCQKMIAPCGRIASIGVHGKSADLQLQDLWSKNITITTANTTCMLLKLLQSGKMKSDQLITHRLQLSQIERVYDTFGNHSKEHTIKTYIETDNL
ncbi:hypothetical protein V1524DRAFT_466811 [Lipomyces starkeyi]